MVNMQKSHSVSLCFRYLNNNNIIRVLASTFRHQPASMSNIYLQSNQIAYIEDGTFDHFTSVTNL